MKFSIDVDLSGIDALPDKLEMSNPRAEHILATQAAKDTAPYVPARTGSLSQRTLVAGNTIIYPGPYARYLYMGKVMVNAATGKGPMHYIGKDNNEYIHFPKGSKLVATERDLDIKQTVNPKAQAKWFEASKRDHLEEWIEVYEKAVVNGL